MSHTWATKELHESYTLNSWSAICTSALFIVMVSNMMYFFYFFYFDLIY